MLLTAAGHNHLSEEACPPTPRPLLYHPFNTALLLRMRRTTTQVLYLNRKRDPSRVKSLRLVVLVAGWRRRKKAWLSTAHFHRCLQLLALASWNTKVCSCSRLFHRQKTNHRQSSQRQAYVCHVNIKEH